MKERAVAPPVPLVPTAWQDVAETQDTPLSPPTPEGRVSWIDHDEVKVEV